MFELNGPVELLFVLIYNDLPPSAWAWIVSLRLSAVNYLAVFKPDLIYFLHFSLDF